MAQAEFSYSGEAHLLPTGRALVRGTRTSGGGRDKKHVFVEVECTPEEVAPFKKPWPSSCSAMDASTRHPSKIDPGVGGNLVPTH